MIFKLHYCFQTPAALTLNLLLRLYILSYSDASSLEVRILFTIMPFVATAGRIIVCSYADRHLAHRECLIKCLIAMNLGYLPIIVIPFLGPSIYTEYARVCWYMFVVAKIFVEIGLGASVSVGDSLANNYARLFKEDYNIYRVWGMFAWMLLATLISLGDTFSTLPRFVPAFILLATYSLLHLILIWRWPKRDCVLLGSVVNSLRQKQNNKHLKQAPKIIVYNTQMAIACVEQQDWAAASVNRENNIDAATQMRIMSLLARLDPRVYLHLAYFVCMGLILSPLDFFFRDLSIIFQHSDTNLEHQYDLQFGMFLAAIAGTAALTYFLIGATRKTLGRVGMFTLFAALASAYYLPFGLNWSQASICNALVAELIAGVMNAIYVSTTVESGDVFANEVELMVPELIRSGAIKSAPSYEKVRLALAATTGALVSMAVDGFGRGLGSLIYNLTLDVYTFGEVSLVVGLCSAFLTLVLLAINLLDYKYKFRLGVDVKAARKRSVAKC